MSIIIFLKDTAIYFFYRASINQGAIGLSRSTLQKWLNVDKLK